MWVFKSGVHIRGNYRMKSDYTISTLPTRGIYISRPKAVNGSNVLRMSTYLPANFIKTLIFKLQIRQWGLDNYSYVIRWNTYQGITFMVSFYYHSYHICYLKVQIRNSNWYAIIVYPKNGHYIRAKVLNLRILIFLCHTKWLIRRNVLHYNDCIADVNAVNNIANRYRLGPPVL